MKFIVRCALYRGHFHVKGVVAQKKSKASKTLGVFDAFDLESLCFVMIACDHDKTEVKPRPAHFIWRGIKIPVDKR